MTIDPARIREIVDYDDNPIVRNLMITQTYSELSRRMADIVGPDNATWATFGCWASKTAGSFIRGEDLPGLARRQFSASAPVRRRAQRMQTVTEDLPGDLASPIDMVRDKAEAIAQDVGLYLQEGNRRVFAEMGDAYVRFIGAMSDGPSEARFNDLVDQFRIGPAEPDKVSLDWEKKTVTSEQRGGQGLLRQMIENYYLAVQEPDVGRKAQFVLLGNAVAGIHEQTRLQGYIFKSLNAPIDDFLRRDLRPHAEDSDDAPPATRLTDRTEGVAERLGNLVADAAKAEWRTFATCELMKMQLPRGRVLDLGRDIRPRRAKALFHPPLAVIDLTPLADLLDQYGALARPRPCRDVLAAVERFVARRLERHCGELLLSGSAAQDWSRLPERMRYILTLFRCFQRDRTLFDPPFTAEQKTAIMAGQIPGGAL